jgi:hypothetical protein
MELRSLAAASIAAQSAAGLVPLPPHNRAYARMNDQFGPDEHWEGNQKPYLHLNIMKKGKPAYAGCLRAQTIEEQ